MKGSLFASYFVCKRQAWLLSRDVDFSKDNDLMQIGRHVHDINRRRFSNVRIERISIDMIEEKEELTIYEIKKSSKLSFSHKYQLYYYLYVLKKKGIDAVGILFYPKEKKQIRIFLDADILKRIEKHIKEAENTIKRKTPPKPVWKKYCRKCSYHDFCWVI